jgi:predicted phage terminase large subunit-like protein
LLYCQPVRRKRIYEALYRAAFVYQRDRVVSIEGTAKGVPVYALQTGTGNYIVWGYCSSNSGNYLNDPVPTSDATFKREWFRYWSPPLPGELDVLMTIDPAISEHRHGDYSAIVVGAVTPAKDIYLLEAWKARVNPHDLIAKIYQLYLEYRPRVVGLEQVAFQRALRFMLEDEAPRRGASIPVVELKPDTAETKEMRIRSLQPLYQGGKVHHTKEMAALEMELLRFRFTKKAQRDDLADALAYLRALTMPPVWKRERQRGYTPECRTTGY